MTSNASGSATDREYVCEHCGKRFVSDWSHKDAEAEAKQLYGFTPAPDDAAVICEDCFERFLPWAREQGYVDE